MKRLIPFLLAVCLGCTSAERGRLTSYGQSHTVQLYSGGELVREWKSTGKVLTESESDGYYFTDGETGSQVRVTGDIVITCE